MILVSILFSIRFFINNINLFQINEVIFLLCLSGLYLYIEGKNVLSALFFVVATCLKLTPAFFLLWLFVRGRRKAAVSIVPLLLVCLCLPLVFRGLETGMEDLSDYYSLTLKSFQQGKVITRHTNQNLAALIYRMTRPSSNPEHIDDGYLPLTEGQARFLYRSSILVLLVLFIANTIFLKVRQRPLSTFEVCTIFLIGHLLSAITWKAHLVTLVFVYLCYFSWNRKKAPLYMNSVIVLIWILIGMIGVLGRDVIGKRWHYYTGGYSIVAWLLLLLFISSVVLSQYVQPVMKDSC
jgi:hypothetical protein